MTISINEKNDLFLNDEANMNLSYDIDDVLQNCQTAVQTTLGEAIYKKNIGVPAFQTLWNGSPNFQQAEASIRATILNVEGVININYFNYVVNNNIFSYNTEIETIFGTQTLENTINV